MAESQKLTPRTKYISLKYHWFGSFIKGPKKMLSIKYTNTKEQTDDIFTNSLNEALFIYLRRKSNGWQPIIRLQGSIIIFPVYEVP